MKIEDIARVEIDWMAGYGNDPAVQFVLKRDRKLTPVEQFRYRQYGNLFFAELNSEVHFYAHDRNDHNGYGGSRVKLHMAEDWDASQWRQCNRSEPKWGNMSTHTAKCFVDGQILTITGPWSSGSAFASKATGIECMDVSTLEGPSRQTVTNPDSYHRQRRRMAKPYRGTAFATHYRLDFVRKAIDRLAPHVEVWQGDYGWTVKLRDMPPKNPRRHPNPVGHATLSGEQSAVVFA